MGNRRRAVTGIMVVGLAVWGAELPAVAKEAGYPNQPITLVVPYPAGGSTDTRARQLAQRMGEDLKVSVVVENKPGASGNIGTAYVAKAKADGYTIGLGNFAPMAVNPSLYGSTMQFDPLKDLVPVLLVERGAVVLAVPSSSPIMTVKDLLERKNAKQGGYNYGSTGAGSASHLSSELFKQLGKVDAVQVPYRGGAPALNGLLGGDIDFYMELPSLFLGYMGGDAPRIRALAVAGPNRLKALPNTPTFAEAGLKGMETFNWFGVVAPAGTPAAVIARLNASINKVLQDPKYREVVDSQGAEVAGGTPEEYRQFIQSESQKWSKLIKERGITLN